MCFVQVFQVTGILFQVHHSFQIQVRVSFTIVPKLTFKSRVCYRVFCHGIARVQRVFQSLESFGDLSKEADEAWWMQSGLLRDLESQRRQSFVKSVGSRSLDSSSTWGRLDLEGLLLFVYSNFILQWIYLLLGRRQRGFSPSSSVSSSITHRGVILCFHPSSLLF